MMKLTCDLQVKRYASLKAGELIGRRIRSAPTVGIALANATALEVMIGYFRFPLRDGEFAPIVVKSELHGSCVSYGHNWVIEPRIDPSIDVGGETELGALLISTDGPVLRFESLPDRWDTHGVDFNLRRLALTEIARREDCLSVPHWLLWHSGEAYRSENSQPLFERRSEGG